MLDAMNSEELIHSLLLSLDSFGIVFFDISC